MGLHASLFEGVDRARLLDMDQRLAPARRNALLVLGVALAVSSPWLGPWTLAPLLLAGLLFAVATRLARTLDHSEYPILGAWVASEVIIALAVAFTGGPRVATMAWLGIPIVTLCRFTERIAKVGAAIALALLIAVGVTDAQAVIQQPPLLIGPAAAIIAGAMLVVAIIRSDVEHRGASLMDELTGLWNRKALDAHAEALQQKARVTGEQVAVIIGDVDNFMDINKRLGHPGGDGALKQIAGRLLGQLRAFDHLYRFGGEEIVVLAPGASVVEAQAVAEMLRTAVLSEQLEDGSRATMSFGVAASEVGDPFDFGEVLARADRALYAAKEAGRDQVRTATQPRVPPELSRARGERHGSAAGLHQLARPT